MNLFKTVKFPVCNVMHSFYATFTRHGGIEITSLNENESGASVMWSDELVAIAKLELEK